jgi:hypothetical protein
LQVAQGDSQADRGVVDGEEGFFLVRLAEGETGIVGEAVALRRDADEVLIELFVAVFVVIKCDGVAAGGGSQQAEYGFAFAGFHADSVDAGAFLQKGGGIVVVKDCGY